MLRLPSAVQQLELSPLSWRIHPALWPAWPRMALLASAAVCVAALTVWVLTPFIAQEWGQAPLDTALSEAQSQLARARTQAAELPGLQTRERDLNQAWASQTQNWPDAQHLPQVVQDLHRLAAQHGVRIDTFKPLPVVLQAPFVEQGVQVHLRAQHAALMDWLADMSQLRAPLRWSQWQVQAAGSDARSGTAPLTSGNPPHTTAAKVAAARAPVLPDVGVGPELSVSLRLAVLRLPTQAELALMRPAPQVAGKAAADQASPPAGPVQEAAGWRALVPASHATQQAATNPFDPQRLLDWFAQRQTDPLMPAWAQRERQREPQWLEQFALEELQLVGQMQQNGQRVALLRVQQRIHPVRVGQYVGPHAGRVLAIDAQSMTLREVYQDEGGQWQQRLVVMHIAGAS